jgi:hypothetical protein
VSRQRVIIAALTFLALVGLLGWQAHRDRLVKACLNGGGLWYGPNSACKAPIRPILQRDYQRS